MQHGKSSSGSHQSSHVRPTNQGHLKDLQASSESSPSLASIAEKRREGVLPRHVALIMDGNGRWAEARGFSRSAGHRAGLAAARRTVEHLARSGVEWITLFAFSSENWNRPKGEVDALMALFARALTREVARLTREGMRLRFLGDRDRFPRRLVATMTEAEAASASNSGPVLTVALGYGGRWDLVEAARRLVQTSSASMVQGVAGDRADPGFASDIDADAFAQALPSADLPDVDLLVRTGGERRISNFLLWQAAYAELMFPEVFWPDVDAQEVDRWLADFATRERRFGRVLSPTMDGGEGRGAAPVPDEAAGGDLQSSRCGDRGWGADSGADHAVVSCRGDDDDASSVSDARFVSKRSGEGSDPESLRWSAAGGADGTLDEQHGVDVTSQRVVARTRNPVGKAKPVTKTLGPR